MKLKGKDINKELENGISSKEKASSDAFSLEVPPRRDCLQLKNYFKK